MNATIKQTIIDFYAANKADVDALATAIGVPAIWFCCLFYNESACQPGAKNPAGGAVGLNQMMPSTLQGLGITADDYVNGGVSYQCEVMKTYFKPVKGIIKRAGDLYLFDFWPAAIIDNYSAGYPIGQKDDTTLLYGISRGKIYDQNASLDFNKDGVINRQDFWDGFEAKYDELLDASGTNFFFQ
jgi:hypothetical protein